MLHVSIGSYKCSFEPWTPTMGRAFDMFAYDTETSEFDDERPDIVPSFVIGTACDGRRGVFLTRETVLPFFVAHADVAVICHNAAFDLKVTQHLVGDRRDLYAMVEADKVWDTLILKRLLSLATEGHTARGESGLDDCVRTHLGLDLNKAIKDSAGHSVRRGFGQFLYQPLARIPAKYLRYAACDPLATWHLFWELNRRIRELLQNSREVWGFVDDAWLRDVVHRFGPLTHHVQLRASIVTDALQRNGIAIDATSRAKKLEQVRAVKDQCEQRLRRQGFPVVGEGSGTAMQAALDRFHEQHPDVPLNRTASDKKWSTAKDDLLELAPDEPFFRDYIKYRAAEKLIATYLAKMDRGRLHAKFGYLLATGRTYCGGGFNLQNLPKESDLLEGDREATTIRGCFVPGEGKVFVDVDFSQIELVVLAYVLKYQLRLGSSLHDLINTGQDVHRLIAAAVLNKPPEQVTKKERNSVKAISFGRPGGMGVSTLQKIAKNNYGQDLTFEEVEQRIAAYHRLCPELDAFLTDEVDAGMVIADALHLTPRQYFEATNEHCHPLEGEDEMPQGWLGGMLLKVLRDPLPVTGSCRPYSWQEVDFFWSRALHLPLDLEVDIRAKLEARQPHQDLWRAVSNWAGPRPVYTVTGRLRANASFCASRNCLFQGAAADGAILALWKLWRHGHKLVASIHDQNVVECPADDRVAERKSEIERLMIEGMLMVVPGMNVRVESVISQSLNKLDVDRRYYT